MSVFNALKQRRSVYALGKKSVLSNSEVTEVVKEAVLLTPSAFNAQTQRVVALFGEESDRFWDLTREALRAVAPEEGFENTVAKLESFKAQGTLLYYIDTAVVKGLQEQFALYAENFPVWAQQENGSLQLVIWTELANRGVGASLQHYNPVVDAAAREAYGIDANWQLVAQMPFGEILDEGSPKEHQSTDLTVKVVGA